MVCKVNADEYCRQERPIGSEGALYRHQRDCQALEFLDLDKVEVYHPIGPISVEEQRIMLWARQPAPHFEREPVAAALISTCVRSGRSLPSAAIALRAVSSIAPGRPPLSASSRFHIHHQDLGSFWVTPTVLR